MVEGQLLEADVGRGRPATKSSKLLRDAMAETSGRSLT